MTTDARRVTPPVTLEDASLRVVIDPVSGAVMRLELPDDRHGMNWVSGPDDPWQPAGHGWGLGYVGEPLREQVLLRRWQRAVHVERTSRDEVVSRYLVAGVAVDVTRTLEDGVLRERYDVRTTSAPLDVGRLAVYVPFRTDLVAGAAGLDTHAHAHVHAAGGRAWVRAGRMSGRGDHLGLALTEGAVAGYALDGAGVLTGSAVRGDLALVVRDSMQSAGSPGSEPVVLGPGDVLTLAWAVFRHTGPDDFHRRRRSLAGGADLVLPDGATTTVGARLVVEAPVDVPAHVRPAGAEHWTPATTDDDGRIVLEADAPGMMDVALGDPSAPEAVATVGFLPDLDELVARRTAFIAARQQVDEPSSPLHGALLPYDNRAGGMVRSARADLNEGRERLGMGVLLAQAVAAGHDTLRPALERYTAFVAGYLQDLDGTVHDSSTDRTFVRLYNYPWVARLWVERFALSGSTEHLDRFLRTVRAFYARGGADFYPIALPVLRGVEVVRRAGRADAEAELLDRFRRHGDALLAHGTSYPTSEVPYEQSIVAPAAAVLLELALVTGDAAYADGAREHVHLLEQFDGDQPDARTHGVPIRHWDGYWFGIDPIWGDTMPHHWAAQSAWVQALAARAWDEPWRAHRARATSRATLLTFFPDGSASCAYSNPLSVDGVRGARWDPLANDQDWALVTALDLRELLDGFAPRG